MTWLRQHWEGVQIVAVTVVSSEAMGYRVQIVAGDGPARRAHENGHYYASPPLALDAADALVRHRLGGHICSASCTGWLESSDVPPR